MKDHGISEKTVAALPTPPKGNKLHYFSGATLQGKRAPSGFAVRCHASGSKSFVWFHRVNGKPYLETLGRWDENAKGGDLTVLRAILKARARAADISKPGSVADPRPTRTRAIEDGNKPAGETVGDMLDQFVQRYVEKENKLRSADAIRSTFERLVKPAIGTIPIYELRRSSVMKMLDQIADENGPTMADRTLSYFRKACNWRATRDDDFVPPIAKGMARTKPKDRARKNILNDDELRAAWQTADAKPGPFSALVKFLILTAARRSEAAGMTWGELNGGADWTLPASRNKTKLDLIRPLSKTAQALLKAQPRNGNYVFTTDGETALSGFSKFKRHFDKASGTKGWTLHDLRRTARSLMSRAGVPSDHAEMCMGHVLGGVRETYDRYEYHDEKEKAYEALAELIQRILNPPADNVANLAARRKAGG